MSTLPDLLCELRTTPLSLLCEECVVSFDAFSRGYAYVDPRLAEMLRDLTSEIPGPSAADFCTRAFLKHAHTRDALRFVLSRLVEAIEASSYSPSIGAAHGTLFDKVACSIESGRYGMVLGEPTISWLANMYQGFLCGLDVVSSERAAEERFRLARFEAWLRVFYSAPEGRWFAILRVFDGNGERGLNAFVERWREFDLEDRCVRL